MWVLCNNFAMLVYIHTGEGWNQMLSKIENAVIEHTQGKTTNWEKVKKTVIRTYPKCHDDVPDMVAWYEKFGGGTSRAFVPWMIALFDKFVDPDRMVSGGFFKALSSLKFTAEGTMPTHLVNATLVVHAAAKEQVSDKHAKFVKNNEVDSIGVKGTNYEEGLQGNQCIVRANQLAKASGLPEHELCEAKFALFDRVVRLIFKYDPNKECKEVNPKFVTFEAIAAEFISDLMKLSPTFEAPESATSSTERKGDDEPANMVEYDSDGLAVAQGKSTLLAKGFKVGANVVAMKGKADEQWNIKSIGDGGDVCLTRIDRHGIAGVESTFGIQEFLRKFKGSKSLVERLKGYPENDAAGHDGYLTFERTCAVGLSVAELARAHACAAFLVQVTPVKKVIAEKAFDIGSLIMVPATNKISLEKRASKLQWTNMYAPLCKRRERYGSSSASRKVWTTLRQCGVAKSTTKSPSATARSRR